MALSLLCGGLGVASAADGTVHVEDIAATATSKEVYTADKVDTLIGKKIDKDLADATYAKSSDVATNTANINNLDGKLANLTTTVSGKADEAAVTTALDSKADTDLSNLTAAGETKIKDTMSADMDLKANKADVNIVLDGKADKATVTDLATKVGDASSGLVKDVADLKTQGNDLNTAIGNKADQSDLDAAKAKITTNETNITALQTKTTGLSADGKSLNSMNRVETDALKVTGEISNGAGVTTTLAKIDESMKQTETNKGDIANLKSKTDTQQTWIGRLNERTTQISYDPAKGTTVNGVDFMAAEVDAHGKGLTGVTTLNTTGNATIGGALTAAEVNAGTGAITGGSLSVIGAVNGISVNAGTLNTTGDATVGGDLSAKNTEINGTLHATGATTLDGALTAKGNVILGTNTAQTVTVNGIADFNEAVNMDNGLTVDKGLNVTSGESNLKNTTVDGTLSVNKETTLNGKLTANDEATFKENVTMEKDLEVKGELKTDKISMKNTDTDPDGTIHRSATTITADSITHIGEVEKSGVITKSQFTHTEEGSETYAKKGDATDWTETRSDVKADGVNTEVKDSKENRTNTSQTANEIKGFVIDQDGNSSTASQTAKGINGNVTDKDGNKTDMNVTATENSIQIQDKDGKNTNHQVNTMGSSVTEIKNAAGATTKTEQTATDITNTAEQGTIKNNAMNIENNATGNITNNAQNGTITNNAKDIVNNATGDMTNNVGGKLTTTVTGQATENFNGGLDTNVTGKENHTVTGDQNIHVTGKQTNEIDGDQENTIGGDQTTTVTGDISNTAKNITNEATTKLTDKVGANTRVLDGEGITDTVGGSTLKSRVTQKKGSIEAVVTDGTSFNHSRDIANASAKTLTGYNKMNQLLDDLNSSTKTIKNEDGKTTKTEQTALDITNTAKDGTITNDAKDIVNNASGNMTNTVGGDLKTTVAGNELREVTGTKTENVTGKVTENYGNGQETNVTGDQYLHVTGKQTNKIDGDQENIIGGNQTTTVTGDISNKAENITNEANTKLTDKVGDHTRVLDSDGITDTVGGSTFKQRIDKIMMESKDVSIKAEETLTNEAKVITNKASEVINNEAVNINNTATGIITSKASEIKNQADKLISNKVGENTWENMENGKITTSIKDGAKQNLTQSDAAGTTQSTVDGGKSTVTIQNADGLTDAVTDGRNTSVQNQTASAIAADVKDGAGNENASVATATTSANTIKNGTKANTVISTADGTSFINSEAAAPVTGASGAGTAVNTTIKGNTITTGKVTMDYAEVMNDLGVHGSATVDNDLTVKGITTTKTLKVTENATVGGTLDVTKKATFHDDVDIAKNLSVGGNATIAGDVTARSYKVDGKTYIDANGINANDQKITNVADGSISEGSKDAVNGGQLYGVKRDLEHQVDKVGANAAAMANLRPMEFDPSSKWNIAAAIGNYGSETAAAIGAFYRPNDNVMVNLSTAFGTGENMVGGGVSVRLGKGGNKLSREETNALKAQVADLTARMDALLSVLNPNMSKDFPDVPENHWAYEAVSRLAGNDIVQGYPDGEFHGERTMTRYEMAEIIYNALSRGAEAEKELVEEFKPELQAMAASEKATAERAEG